MQSVYLIKIGEIALKGKNRGFFEKQLKKNLRSRLKGISYDFTGGRGRHFIELKKDQGNKENHKRICNVLETTFGIVGYAHTLVTEKKVDSILNAVLTLIEKEKTMIRSFKAKTKRADRKFTIKSMELNCMIGDKILDHFPKSFVDVHTPELTIYVEIRDKAYIYLTPKKGPGGLPVGVAGRGTLMLSGGIDSPVAAWMMAKRGLKLDAVYFHAYPYTSEKAKEKVIQLAAILSPWLNGINLFIVPFTDVQMEIKKNGPEDESTILMRCCMMQIANKITQQRNNSAVVTGEALSQVASQTTESLRVSGSHTDYPILRPLIGMDKEEIITIARTIKTFEISILPYEDCCTLFSPKYPVIKPNFKKLQQSFKTLNVEALIEKAIENSERIYLKNRIKQDSSTKNKIRD